jgi:molybdopterin-guanine dinucleotide biosynthesis protein A
VRRPPRSCSSAAALPGRPRHAPGEYDPAVEAAAIVLVGGRSSRMGTPKAALEWHGTTLLHRTTAVLARTVSGPVIVVRAPGQLLPELPRDVRVVEDPVEGVGPLQGIAAGLSAVPEVPLAFVTSTDLPFLHPRFAGRVLAALDHNTDVALPVARGYRQPLAAGYRTALAPLIAELLDAGRNRPPNLFERCRVRELTDADLLADPALAEVDPDLDSLLNVNSPEDYAAARARPGPWVTVERYGPAAGRGGPRHTTVQAATLGAAAAAAGVVLDPYVAAALNGERVGQDPRLPLVAGDTVAFVSAAMGG